MAYFSPSAAWARASATSASSTTLVAITGPQPAARASRRAVGRNKLQLRYPDPGTVSNLQWFCSCGPVPAHLPSMPMIALFAAALLAGPISQLSDQELDARIAQGHSLPFNERIDRLTGVFLGTPYGELPLGEGGTGPEPQ